MKLTLSKVLELATAINILETTTGENGETSHLRLTPRGAYRLARNRRLLFEAVAQARTSVEKLTEGLPEEEVLAARQKASDEIGKEEVELALEAIPVGWVNSFPDHGSLLAVLASLDGSVFTPDE